MLAASSQSGGEAMKRIIVAILAAGCLAGAVAAQQGAAQPAGAETNPLSNAVRRSLDRATKNLTAAADEMPADKYDFKPTAGQITFGHLVLHVAGSNNLFCSKISGTAAPEADKLTETDGKEKLVAALKASFAFCSQVLAKLDDSNLGEQITLFGTNKASRAGAMVAITSSFADHYSEAAMYLRLNGLTPPTAQAKKE
jgi:uncharacterized damage-inducible protein DinB